MGANDPWGRAIFDPNDLSIYSILKFWVLWFLNSLHILSPMTEMFLLKTNCYVPLHRHSFELEDGVGR